VRPVPVRLGQEGRAVELPEGVEVFRLHRCALLRSAPEKVL
jgi:hypothetical protein